MRRRKKSEEHVSHERWLMSYADFITLLFALFVVLYASSQVDKRKIGRLALSIQVAFQELGVFDTSNTKIPLSDSEAVPFSQVQVVENTEHTSDFQHFVQPMKGVLSPNRPNVPLLDIEKDIQKALAPEILNRVVDVKSNREGIIVSLREIGFYESGSATLRASSQSAIERLATILRARPETLRVEGHTDNVPIHNSRFDSNWDLSAARSANFIKLFITVYHFDPARLSAAGYAEYRPVASNDTPEGRAMNRRVDIVVLNPPAPERLTSAEIPKPVIVAPIKQNKAAPSHPSNQ
jgi:chemotaxis protein MotB